MPVNFDDIIKVKINEKMKKRAQFLAEQKLGVKLDAQGKITQVNDDNIYDRYGYKLEDRYKRSFLGELGEEACKPFIKSLALAFVCYNDQRTDEFRDDDPFDYKIGDFRIDIKTSKDNNNHGLQKILSNQHLLTPIDQTVKPIVIQCFINNDENTLWIVSWTTEEELRRPENIGLIGRGPQGGGKFYKLKVKNCHPMKYLKEYLNKGKIKDHDDTEDRDLIMGLIPRLGQKTIEKLQETFNISTCKQLIEADPNEIAIIKGITKERCIIWQKKAVESIAYYAHSRSFSKRINPPKLNKFL